MPDKSGVVLIGGTTFSIITTLYLIPMNSPPTIWILPACGLGSATVEIADRIFDVPAVTGAILKKE